MSTRGNEFTKFAETTFSQSGASGLYDRARPDYPQQALDNLFALLPANGSVVELGSGTGLFTRMLLKDGRSNGKLAKLLCVEPSEGMRKGFNDKLQEAEVGQIDLQCVDGLFDQIPSSDASADMVVAAQGLLVCATSLLSRMQLINFVSSKRFTGRDTMVVLPSKRLLACSSRVATPSLSGLSFLEDPGLHQTMTYTLVRNLEDRSVDWVAHMRDLFEKYEAGTPQYRHGYWKMIYDTPEYNDNFQQHQVETFHRGIPVTEDLAIERVLSKSYITALDDAAKATLSSQLRDVIRGAKDKMWIDEQAGTFEYPYSTDMFIHKRK
ncbi:hypothetical protein OIV83_004868 [Microbotryomycetes sp. JL201]|nr:hypothetical protein OIV83_004868 [Microbotryomycetes sp. JL201]